MLTKLKGLQFPVLLFGAASCSFLFWVFMLSLSGPVIVEIELFSISSVVFSFLILVDKISLSFGVIVLFIAGSVFTFAHKYMEEDHFSDRFLWVLMLFVISMNLLTFSGSLFFLLIGWDGLGITSFALIIYYQSFESLSAGFQTLMINRLGDALIVVSTFLFVLTHQFNFISIGVEFFSVTAVLCVAGLTKSAQYPFSSWLPVAMAAPTPVSALVHSSTLVTAGIFLIIRLSFNIPLSSGVSDLLIFVGSITCLLGGWSATYENDIKKIIALSTLSQLGVMVFSLGLGLPNLALFHLYTHAMFKALLFLAAGNMLMASFGNQDIRLLGGIGIIMPFTVVMFNISSLCLVGAPFLSAFYSKHMILEKMVMSSLNMTSMIIFFVATVYTAKYVFRTMKAILWSKPVGSLMSVSSNFYTSFPVFMLGIGGIVGGKFMIMLDLSNYEYAFIPGLWEFMISFVGVLGLLLGVNSSSQKSFYLSYMFFLSPAMALSAKPLSIFTKEISNLDYGWLEPSFSMKFYPMALGSFISKLGNWPMKQTFVLSFISMCFILFLI